MAKGCRRVDALCYKINLTFKLLDSASGFQDLREIVKEAKNMLDTEVGPLDGISANEPRGHGLVSKLAVGAEVKKLCTAAVEMADEISTARLEGEGPVMSELGQTANPNNSNETGLNFICPDLNIDITGTDSDKEVAEGTNCDTAAVHDGNMECFFEYDGVMMIRRLECEKHLTSEVRLKLVTWLSVKSTEGERRIVNAFIQAFGDDHTGLAAQLKSTFANVINATE
ncbi:uncharacterized protein LOC143566359 [Bidens hawaiensis]|uniref:uncharacterized protein LOC143566359 n=1 Tax=Bidens hawaiensis TaxID=980011 RepID=UPI00404B278C